MNKKTRFKNILLVNLPGVEQAGFSPIPLGALYLVSYVKKYFKKIKIEVIDGAIEGEAAVLEKITKIKPDLLGISVMTPSRCEAIKISTFAKRNNPYCRVVLGGIHPTLMWQQMMMNYDVIDYIVKGEGEEIFYELISNKNLDEIDGLVWRKNNEIINNIERKLIKVLDKIPFPAWEMVDPLKYQPLGQGTINGINLNTEIRYPIIFSRGCMGSCTFCSTWRVWKGYRFRSGKNVADEIEILVKKYNAKHFAFKDDTLTGSRKEMIIFCKEIIKRKIHIAIFGTTRVDYVDEKLLQLMKKAGFYKLSYGIESGSSRLLLSINKKTDLEQIKRAINLTKKSGIQVCALMMFGLPGETEKDRQLSKKLLKITKPDEIGTIGEIWIFPGTALFQQAKAAKLIDDSFWLSRRPYYIYRGGIAGDPINKKLLIEDWYNFYLKKTILGQLLDPFIRLKRNYFNVRIYYLKEAAKNLNFPFARI